MHDSGPLTSPSLLGQLFNPENGANAWVSFLRRYQPFLMSRCARLGLQHADAEDVTACVLAKLARALQNFTYDPRRHFRAWLQTVITNAVRDLRDYQRNRPAARGGDSNQDVLGQAADPWTIDALTEELGEGLGGELRRAEEASQRVRQRVAVQTWEAFRLTALEGMPASEAAERLGIPVANVYTAKRRVAKLLREEGKKLAGFTDPSAAGEAPPGIAK